MKNSFLIKFLLFILVSSLSLLCLSAFLTKNDYARALHTSSLPDTAPKYTKVIIDAGHGGEDGGASSKSGLVEKDVNLSIAKKLADMLKMSGVEVIMTREDDRLLYDRNCDYKGRKKKLDLAARLEIMNQYDNAIFVSIHMNAFTDRSCSGLQVWYSKNDAASLTLAKTIQNNARLRLQTNNKRVVKEATSAINLLFNATCPAVLIECGFLSNPDEASRFATAEYRGEVAENISYSIMEFLKSSDVSS